MTGSPSSCGREYSNHLSSINPNSAQQDRRNNLRHHRQLSPRLPGTFPALLPKSPNRPLQTQHWLPPKQRRERNTVEDTLCKRSQQAAIRAKRDGATPVHGLGVGGN